MNPQPYSQLSDEQLLYLCIWREARGLYRTPMALLAVGWSIRNRADHPSWWSKPQRTTAIQSVILKPWQYSSFNSGDPNASKWPSDTQPADIACQNAANAVLGGTQPDPTNGATHYYDISISFPASWGHESGWINTLDVGRLRFWKERPPVESSDTLEEA